MVKAENISDDMAQKCFDKDPKSIKYIPSKSINKQMLEKLINLD